MKSNKPSQLQDKVFKQKFNITSDFSFNEKVALVFDDMVSRSVPFYAEMQQMVSELAKTHAQPSSNVYDLGCSTGTTLLQLDKLLPENVHLTGMDDSEEMIAKCREKLNGFSLHRKIDLAVVDLTKDMPIENASVVTMLLVLQFIRPVKRLDIVRAIFHGMNKEGVLILMEKILTEEPSFNRQYIDYYYDFKRRNNYSELEISQKREALENILIPYKTSENVSMLKDAGFNEVEVFFRWYNFSGIIAKK